MDTADTAAPPTADTGSSPAPMPPPDLERWLTGNEANADVAPLGPGLILMGGGAEPDEAFEWWRPKLANGDVVVLRTSGSDGYNDYLFTDIGSVDSVETLLVDTAALAQDPYVAYRIETAEAVFMAGGDQWTYLNVWGGTPVQDALQAAWDRGAIVGGTSAGLAVLGDSVFSARNGTVYSHEALADPYNEYMTFAGGLLETPLLDGVIPDTHFGERDRMGRLVAFVSRAVEDGLASEWTGLGVDESTAVLVEPDGSAQVVGTGNVYIVKLDSAPATCDPGVPLVVSGMGRQVLSAGDTLTFPGAISTAPVLPLGASGGSTTPINPY